MSPVSLKKMMSNNFNFKSIAFDGLKLNIFKYNSENTNNLEFFINKLQVDKNTIKTKPELNFIIQQINGTNSKIVYKDYNILKNDFVFTNLNLDLKDISLLKNKIELDIKNVSFNNKKG